MDVDATVCVRDCNTVFEAEIAKNTLEANGIRALILADDAGRMLFPMRNQVRVMVLKEDLERARTVLISAGEPPEEESEAEEEEP